MFEKVRGVLVGERESVEKRWKKSCER